MKARILVFALSLIFGSSALAAAADTVPAAEPQAAAANTAVAADPVATAPEAPIPAADSPLCHLLDPLVPEPTPLDPAREIQPTGWDPATCGVCGSYCSSDNLCLGRLLGDLCGPNGQTCKARTGCALFNCCKCG